MVITFEPKEHVYSVNGNIANISVTELLKKHGLSTDYSKVNKTKLAAEADIGKAIHKDCELIVNSANYTPTTPEGEAFAAWAKDNLDCGVAEMLLGYAYHEDLIIAGTCDLIGFMRDGTPVIGDHKTTSPLDKESVSWQVSLLDYMTRKLGDEPINGKSIKNWRGAVKFLCWLYDKKEHTMTLHELERISDEQIEKLLDAEFKGEIYQRPLLVIDAELALQGEKAEARLLAITQEHERVKAETEAFRAKILTAFEEQKIKSWVSPNSLIQITYVPATTALQVDSKRLRKEQPLVYDKYTMPVQKKAYIRVYDKTKGDEENV